MPQTPGETLLGAFLGAGVSAVRTGGVWVGTGSALSGLAWPLGCGVTSASTVVCLAAGASISVAGLLTACPWASAGFLLAGVVIPLRSVCGPCRPSSDFMI